MTGEMVAFGLVAGGAVLSALGVVASRDVVHAVLFMVANFVLTAVLYIMLHAPFLAMVQVVVYAGAIMVLFLFVVMLMGPQRVPLSEPLAAQRRWGLPLLAGLLGLLLWAARAGVPAAEEARRASPTDGLADAFGGPYALGDALFRAHVLPFEVVSALLLVAMIGAVMLSRLRDVTPADAPPAEGEAGAPAGRIRDEGESE